MPFVRRPLTDRLTARGRAGLVLLFLALAGCAGMTPEPWSAAPRYKEPRAEEGIYAHTVRFAPGADRLEPEERVRLDRFLASLQARADDTVRLAGAPDGLNQRRTAVVGAYLRLRSLEPAPAGLSADAAAVEPDTVRVEVRRYLVRLPGCPDWTDEPGRTFSNTASANWGCASATNLGLMVAEPGDLAFGRRPAPMDGAYGALAIERYRKGEIRPLQDGQSVAPNVPQPGAGGQNGTAQGAQP